MRDEHREEVVEDHLALPVTDRELEILDQPGRARGQEGVEARADVGLALGPSRRLHPDALDPSQAPRDAEDLLVVVRVERRDVGNLPDQRGFARAQLVTRGVRHAVLHDRQLALRIPRLLQQIRDHEAQLVVEGVRAQELERVARHRPIVSVDEARVACRVSAPKGGYRCVSNS